MSLSPLRSRLRSTALAIPFATLVLAASAAAAPAPLELTGTVDAEYSGNVSVPGSRVALVGDFNGDGTDDHAYATNNAYAPAQLNLVFGQLGSPDGGGAVQFTGATTATNGYPASYVVDGAGDVDGDGFDDLVVSPTAPINVAYIIYGAASTPASTPLAAGPRITAISTGTPGSPLVQGIGDFNGDGFDDIAVAQMTGAATTLNPLASQAIVLGGPRVTQINALATGARVSLIKGSAKCQLYFFIPICSTTVPRVAGIGDFNGDGKDDLAVDSTGSAGRSIVLGRTGSFAIAANSPGSGSVNLTARLAPSGGSDPYESRRINGAGDLNGDGLADVVIPISRVTNAGPQWAILLGRRSPASALPASEPVILLGKPNEVLTVQAAGDQNGDGRDDVFVGYLTAFRMVSLAPGTTSPIDLASFPLVNLPSHAGPGDLQFDGPGDIDGDGAPDLVGATLYSVYRFTHGASVAPVQRQCAPLMIPRAFRVSDGAQLSVAPCTDTKLRVDYYSSTRHIGERYPTLGPGETTTPFDPTILGPLTPGQYTVSVTPRNASGDDDGLTLSADFEILPEVPSGATPTIMSDPAWARGGSAAVIGDATLLTNKPGQTGTAVWPAAFNPNGKTIEFSTTLSGGNGQAEGVTMAFLRGSGPIPPGGLIGGGLGLLGFGGLDGVALALDEYKQAGDPTSNFLGIADGVKGDSLNYLQTADPGMRLRAAAATRIKFVSKDGVVSVFVNDKLRLTRTMTLPSVARLAFTGSTGASVYQVQYVNTIKVSNS